MLQPTKQYDFGNVRIQIRSEKIKVKIISIMFTAMRNHLDGKMWSIDNNNWQRFIFQIIITENMQFIELLNISVSAQHNKWRSKKNCEKLPNHWNLTISKWSVLCQSSSQNWMIRDFFLFPLPFFLSWNIEFSLVWPIENKNYFLNTKLTWNNSLIHSHRSGGIILERKITATSHIPWKWW